MRQGWEIRKLGDIASFTSGSRPTGGVGGIKEGALSLGGEHIGKNGWLDLTSPKYVEQDYYIANPKGHIIDNDILLCKDGALTGKVAIVRDELVGKKAMVNEHVFIIRSSVVRQQCLYYFLFSPIGQTALKARITGAAQGGINGANLKTILVPVPPIQEQEKIFAELDCLTGIIEKKKLQLEELDKLAQSIFYDMFGDPITNEKGWEVKKLGECFPYMKNGANIKQERGADGIPITRIETLSGGVFNRDRLGYANIQAVGKYDKNVLNDGDILMSHINSKAYIGRAVVYHKVPGETIIHGMNLLRLIAESSLISPVFAELFFKTDYFKEQIASIRKDAVNQSSVATGDLKALKVVLPPLDLQNEFAKKIEAIEKQKELVKQSILETETLFNSRMDYWFN